MGKSIKAIALVRAGVLELADEVDSKSIDGDIVRVQVPPPAPKSQIEPQGLVWDFLFLLGWRDLKPKRVAALIILIRKNGDFTFSTTTHKSTNPKHIQIVFGVYISSGFIIMISRFFLLAYAMVLAVPPLLPSHTAIM